MNTEAIKPEDQETPPLQITSEEDAAAWRAKVDARLDAGAANMRNLRADLKINSDLTTQVHADTRELVSLLNSFQGAFKVFDLVGRIAKPLGYIVMACSAVLAFWTAIKGGVSPK